MPEPTLRTLRRIAIIAVLTSLASLALAAFALLRRPDELTVHRINIVEPDGTPRMILANRARFPGSFARGAEIPRPDRADIAGVLFVNDEGTENGGLVQNGSIDPSGKVNAGLSLTFDRFRNDQMLQLLVDESGDNAHAGLTINDRPSHKLSSIFDIMTEVDHLPPAARDAALKHHQDLGHFGAPRAYFGTRRGAATLMLDDAQGRPRLQLSVSATGAPTIEFLDENGHVTRTL